MGFAVLHSRSVLRAGLLRVIAPSSAQASPISAAKRHSAAEAEPAQRPQRTPLSASAVSSTLAERESTAAPVEVPELGLSRDFGAKYELMQPIGRGTFKTTHLASERSSNTRVAVSVLAKERAGVTVEHNLQMIQQEIDITRSMQGVPGVIRMHGVYEDDKNVYIVTELCQGGDLEQYLRVHGAMAEGDAVVVLHDILHVLAECNRQKVCYADVKPANFLLKSRLPAAAPSGGACTPMPPDIRVIDFGCAQHVVDGAKLAKRTGTPLFLPPEMFMRHWGPEADLWSAGMVAYQLLSGKLPFWGGSSEHVSPLMVMQEILGGDISFAGEEWAGVSAEAVDFVSRLLDRDYTSRMTAEQALQHPWVAGMLCSGHAECSLDWEEEPEYNMMRTPQSPGRGRAIGKDGVQYCVTDWEAPASPRAK